MLDAGDTLGAAPSERGAKLRVHGDIDAKCRQVLFTWTAPVQFTTTIQHVNATVSKLPSLFWQEAPS